MKLEAGGTAVVTGAGSGIGAALVDVLLSRGLGVAALDVEGESLDRLAAQVRDDGRDDVRLLTVQCDVSDPAEVTRARDAVLDRFGGVDLVCSNAGVIGPRLPTWQQTPQDWRWVLDVNLGGTVAVLSAFLPLLVAAGRGHVVVTSSIAGLAPVPGGGNAPYVASKYAAVGICETLREEFAAAGVDVGVTVVCPGPVATRIRDAARNRPAAMREDDDEARIAGHPPVFGLAAPSISAEDAATQVLDAVERGTFYLLTNRGTGPDVRRRSEELLAALPPD